MGQKMAAASSPAQRRHRRISNAEQRLQALPFLTAFESVSLSLSGFLFRDNFLGPRMAREIRAEALRYVKNGTLRPAGIGRQGERNESVRGDHLCWMEKLDAGPGVKTLMKQFEALRLAVNREFYLGLDRYEMQLAHYPPGSQGYKKHLDAFSGRNERNRRLTAIYYLNPGWLPGDGGELAVYPPSTELHLEPLADRLVVFFSEQLEHAVLPNHKGRLALTAWFHAP